MPVHANIEPLRWESDFFGFASGKLVFDPAAPPVSSAGLDAFNIVQAKVAAQCPQQLDALAALNFRLVESEIDLSVNVAPPAGPDIGKNAYSETVSHSSAKIRFAGAADIPALRAMASTAFTLSRFREPWYSGPDSSRFYALWAENAVLGRFDHRCLVAGPPEAVNGMVTLRDISAEEVRIGLLAVDPAFGGRGIGRLLFNAALDWCRDHHKKRLRVATQTGNIAALRLYIACGATIDSAAYWLYR
ncbi:dTDP-4-amino-4,6-dideoxy-D-galactose acyltransferase [Sodalis ligni]|uniref:dTDP-4-amino-4,6-dideoxy-D-galactose acyltransferase n=1 Tax=Sodalis ligni TaxID=2697027 RepID=UPI00193F3F7E|nr:dTDP-4-amino-4,6-dideoxy-D-galactose acyltransferase [Sodalis ligni]QWA11533.1 dTDP-4-amino-4,6-dideoxy-D-galactose acyltransferase [Sodalis ligni]